MTTCGAYIFGCAGPVLTAQEAAFFRDADPWGFILFGRNVDTPDQLRRLTSDLRAAVGRDAPILIDQEGGRVQRMGPPHWRGWLPPLEQVVCAGDAPARVLYLRYRLIAAELRAAGIDVNCAPLADVAADETHPFLRNRCFSADLDEVVSAARASADGMLAGGVLPVVKHIPGHGRATLDSHLNLPRVATPLAALQARDFAAFKALADLPMAMTAHLLFDAIDPVHPATQSPACVAMIRDEIGFDGLLMTDDLSMQALSGTMQERAAASMAAGCDLVLHCNGKADEMQAVVLGAGTLQPEGVARAERTLAMRHAGDTVDLAALDAELAALMAGAARG
ncbi:glycoside hydrolase family 3 protein [Pseudoruegeria sp. SK021]|uniref:glycoside hydrolase family 3 N-terminal domain-containing protein n=1 Tax=Pseudoruegeria sp. SK021 TaxID=1933035 RepID=UPI000A23D4F3|nr:glycoside hydrolase family 3 protein [Pseudoruegeria sp. SK021]OSP55440.1 beta-hexosaminidase [Pseudoruegeria sp. SK021]